MSVQLASTAAAARWLCLLLILALASTPASAVKCFKTEIGATPHEVQCGSTAKACRVLVKPYKTQNDSAVTDCNNDQMFGRYIFDCAVDCPDKKEDWNWNEMDCCKGDSCNNGALLRKQTKCYISKGKASAEADSIQSCDPPKRCAINVKTQETKCLDNALCKGGDWKCCFEDSCLNTNGVEKISLNSMEEESVDANSIQPSFALAIACLLVARSLLLVVSY